MQALARAIRIYWSDDHYGEPRESPSSEPLVVSDLPRQGDHCSVWFGSVPDEIRQVVRERDAMGAVLLNHMFGLGDEATFDAAMDKILSEKPLGFDDRAWYVTLALERPVELNVENVEGAEPDDIHAAEDPLRAEAPAAFEMMAAAIGSMMGAAFFRSRTVTDRFFLTLEGRERPVFMPRLQAQATLSTGKPIDSFPLDAMRSRLNDLSERSQDWEPWLGRAAYWYSEMLVTDDRWKRFQWGFLALEVLTNKLAELLRTPAMAALRMKVGDHESAPSSVLEQTVWEHKRMPLANRFALIASYLSPATAAEDVAAFRAAKKVRNAISHGDPVDVDQLPVTQVHRLLSVYIELALKLP